MTHRTLAASTRADQPALLDVQAAVVAVLGLPPLEGLPDGQARGARCVWCDCGPLTTETAVDLGEHKAGGVTAFPRSCRPCASERALRALHAHAPAAPSATPRRPAARGTRSQSTHPREGTVVKFCGCCDQPIRKGEKDTTHDTEAASGPGTTVYRHVYLCKKVPTQTSQVTPHHRTPRSDAVVCRVRGGRPPLPPPSGTGSQQVTTTRKA